MQRKILHPDAHISGLVNKSALNMPMDKIKSGIGVVNADPTFQKVAEQKTIR